MRTLVLTVFTVLVMLAGPAVADDGFHKVPASGKKTSKKIKLRVVRYDGAVNGELTVEVKNTGSAAAKFDARGLYFVPDVDADEAPQRLGAVGPMKLAGEDEDELDAVTIAAGDTVTVTLDVFCIDSHRDSPTSETPFTVGKKRMPASLARKVDRAGRKAAKAAGGFDDDDAFEDVQHAVWKVRDKDWVQLEGEGVQEADK